MREHKAVFNYIYNHNIWGSGSGHGSTEKNTRAYRLFLQDFIRTNQIKSVIDIGCGDWQFSQLIDWTGIEYIGVDVSDVILSNLRKFSRPGVEFLEANALFDELPPAELAIIKDVLQHWSNDEIVRFLPKLNKFDKALITNGFHPAGLSNLNKNILAGGWRPVNLAARPFNLKGNYVFVFDAGEPKWVFLWKRN